jgi:hypothetical protein
VVSIFKLLRLDRHQKQEMLLQSAAIGINSTVGVDAHIVMLDYDEKNIEKIIHSVIELQEFWNLSDAFIYQTRNGHHVMFWYDIVPYGRLKMIIEFAKYVDPMYKLISKFYNHKTLRVAGKYSERDIFFLDKIEGDREPSTEEMEIGNLKMREHKAWLALT